MSRIFGGHIHCRCSLPPDAIEMELVDGVYQMVDFYKTTYPHFAIDEFASIPDAVLEAIYRQVQVKSFTEVREVK